MDTEVYPIRYWENPKSDDVAERLEDFLMQLESPVWIYIPGRDSSRCRVISTLLHGNEPSGLYAMHHWLRAELQPAVDLYFFVGAVEAAQASPLFSHRHLPERRDLNRCFRPPFNDEVGQIAADFIRRLTSVQPEAVIDIHNTSGAGPCFAVACNTDKRHRSIAQLFTDHLIITEIRLGALMEFQGDYPITTIECGGARDPAAHQRSWQGLKKFAILEQLFTDYSTPAEMTLFHHPLRVELFANCELVFGDAAKPSADLTLLHDIERFNFGTVPAQTQLGWLGPQGLKTLVVRDSVGNSHTNHYFSNQDSCLRTNMDLKLFMITKNSAIAKADCLFYLVPA